MKRFTMILVLAALPLLLCAQPGRPRPEDLSDEELVQMQARDIAGWLNLEESVKTKFISVYTAFRGEINAVAADSKPGKRAESEDEIEAAIKKNFEVSEKILGIRENYYAEFRKFMKPSQIRQMYRFENEAGRRMNGGPEGPVRPGERRGDRGPEQHGPGQHAPGQHGPGGPMDPSMED